MLLSRRGHAANHWKKRRVVTLDIRAPLACIEMWVWGAVTASPQIAMHCSDYGIVHGVFMSRYVCSLAMVMYDVRGMSEFMDDQQRCRSVVYA